jgi:CRISPR system Cascade subunit CasC
MQAGRKHKEPTMLIEIHIIQNHSPANLNRDDLGAPKTCLFGGTMRARISSQCLKRSIRRSAEFQKALEQDGGVRTRRLAWEIARRAHPQGDPPEDLLTRIRNAFKAFGVNFDVENDPNATDIIWFVPDSAINKMAEAARGEKSNLAAALAEVLREKAAVPDIALSGRMTEFRPKEKEFSDLPSQLRVEAALATAHAISTHEVTSEIDYFTAADDLALGSGAAHVNESMFASACFYKYFCIDWNQLVENLGGNKNLARLTVEQFLRGAALSVPSGKQTSFAAFNPPDGVLVEVKAEKRLPVSYANAFADPVRSSPGRPLISESIARLGQYVHDVAEGYEIPAERFWFSPGNQYQLAYLDRQAPEPDRQKPVTDAQHTFGRLECLVAHVMDAIDKAVTPTAIGAAS